MRTNGTFKTFYMQKIISLFQRNYNGDRQVRNEVVPGAEWVINGEGIATRKWDGLALLYKDGRWYKRCDVKQFTLDGDRKRNYNRSVPKGFVPAQEPDEKTGHWPGWVPLQVEWPGDKLMWETILQLGDFEYEEGTYEFVGPKVGTRGGPNPENLNEHHIIKHGKAHWPDVPRTFEELKEWFIGKDIEGIVWYHPDGRRVKIKKKDFGLDRNK